MGTLRWVSMGFPGAGCAGGVVGVGSAAGLMFPGGRVKAPSMGFSISMVPPHFVQRVFTLGRSASRLSSNLYRDWQFGQVMIIDGSSAGLFR